MQLRFDSWTHRIRESTDARRFVDAVILNRSTTLCTKKTGYHHVGTGTASAPAAIESKCADHGRGGEIEEAQATEAMRSDRGRRGLAPPWPRYRLCHPLSGCGSWSQGGTLRSPSREHRHGPAEVGEASRGTMRRRGPQAVSGCVPRSGEHVSTAATQWGASST